MVSQLHSKPHCPGRMRVPRTKSFIAARVTILVILHTFLAKAGAQSDPSVSALKLDWHQLPVHKMLHTGLNYCSGFYYEEDGVTYRATALHCDTTNHATNVAKFVQIESLLDLMKKNFEIFVSPFDFLL